MLGYVGVGLSRYWCNLAWVLISSIFINDVKVLCVE